MKKEKVAADVTTLRFYMSPYSTTIILCSNPCTMETATYMLLPLRAEAEGPARAALGGLDRLAHVLHLIDKMSMKHERRRALSWDADRSPLEHMNTLSHTRTSW